jgi:DNA replication protein DnaC
MMGELTRLGSALQWKEPKGLPSPDLFNHCETCGTIPPRLLPSGRYIRRSCACQIAERRRKQAEAASRAWEYGAVQQTYGWLGRGWEDTDLSVKTFATFDRKCQPKGYQETTAFAGTLHGTLILHGGYGTGKTHLLAAVCNALRSRGATSLFTTAPKFFAAYQDRMGHEQDYWSLVKMAISTPLLVLDDVDKAKPSEAREQLYWLIIDERVKAGRPIALSTNKMSELAHYVGEASVSRLMVGVHAVEMVGRDMRLGGSK